MINKVFLAEDTYNDLLASKKAFQNNQLKNFRDGVNLIRKVLEYEGFHADGTSEKLGMMLDIIENKWIPELENYFEQEEYVADQLMQIMAEIDKVQ